MMEISEPGKKVRTILIKWDYIIIIFEMDHYSQGGESWKLPKLTEVHIREDKLKKMNVKNAIQVLSGSVAAQIELRAGKFFTFIFKNMLNLGRKININFFLSFLILNNKKNRERTPSFNLSWCIERFNSCFYKYNS